MLLIVICSNYSNDDNNKRHTTFIAGSCIARQSVRGTCGVNRSLGYARKKKAAHLEIFLQPHSVRHYGRVLKHNPPAFSVLGACVVLGSGIDYAIKMQSVSRSFFGRAHK
jgi:hypothetical protein